MNRKRLLFVFNPRSGKGLIKNHLVEIIDIFIQAGYEVIIHSTQARGDAYELIKERASEFDLVVASGGDGTLNETIEGITDGHHNVPIGYIPAGSTNDYARSIHIPKNMKEAAMVAVHGVAKELDVGDLNGDSFIYIAAFGLFTDVSYQTPQNLKNKLGHAAYVMESAKRLKDVPAYRMTVRFGSREFTDDFAYGMITNSTSVGGMKNLPGKDVKLDDGVFEVNLVRMPQNPLELNEIFATLLNVKERSEYIYSFRTSHLELECEHPVAWTIDGEFGGEHTKVVIENVHRGIRMMVPADGSEEREEYGNE